VSKTESFHLINTFAFLPQQYERHRSQVRFRLKDPPENKPISSPEEFKRADMHFRFSDG